MLDYMRVRSNPSPRLPTQQPIPKSRFSSGLPNSAMLPTTSSSDPDLGEKMRQRLSVQFDQDPAAEAEADRLSKGVRASTPEGVRSEMGHRLGADLSGVRLHTGGAEAERADHMGANAFTVGQDIYFGSGGFRADTAAHEMVHTVQQGAAEGGVSVFVPMGSVQMQPVQTQPVRICQDILDKIRYTEFLDKARYPDSDFLYTKLKELNRLADEYGSTPGNRMGAELQWVKLRQELMRKTEENCAKYGSREDAGWTNDMKDLLLELRAPGIPTFDKDMRGFEKWMKHAGIGGVDKIFNMDNHVFESVSTYEVVKDEKGKRDEMDLVGSIYFGHDQGRKGGRLRLLHKNGPKIVHYDHVFRYTRDNKKVKPKRPEKELKQLKQLKQLGLV